MPTLGTYVSDKDGKIVKAAVFGTGGDVGDGGEWEVEFNSKDEVVKCTQISEWIA